MRRNPLTNAHDAFAAVVRKVAARHRGFCLLVATLVAAALCAVQVAATPAAAGAATLAAPNGLKEISYYPSDGGWTLMWTDWRPDRYAADFALIRGLGANTVRLIIQPGTFGYPQPDPVYLDRLRQLIDLASANELRVQLTLFDWFNQYTDVAGSQQWATAILDPFISDPRLAAVEVKNEVDPTDAAAVGWARSMIPFLQRLLKHHAPVTISVAGFETQVHSLIELKAGLGNARPDFYSIHEFGGGGDQAYWDLAAAKRVAAPVPIWVGETGYPTTTALSGYDGLPLTASAQEAAQCHYLKTLALAAYQNGLPPIGIWTLYDFLPGAIPAPNPTAPPVADAEYHFGLYHADGSPKPAAALVRQLFSQSTPPQNFDNGFEQTVADPAGNVLPAEWSGAALANGQLTIDHTTFHTGHASAELRSIDGLPTGGSLYITPTNDAATATAAQASVWIRSRSAGAQVRLVLVWQLRSGYTISRSVKLSSSTDGWTLLRLVAKRPGAARCAHVYLEVSNSRGAVWFDDVQFTPLDSVGS